MPVIPCTDAKSAGPITSERKRPMADYYSAPVYDDDQTGLATAPTAETRRAAGAMRDVPSYESEGGCCDGQACLRLECPEVADHVGLGQETRRSRACPECVSTLAGPPAAENVAGD